jgi:hypothetical protein
MTGDRKRVTGGIVLCGALFLLAPAWAAAQDPVPPPAPKQDTVTIRAMNGTFELKGASSPDLFEFAEQCGSKAGSSGSIVRLTLPLDLEAGPNDSLQHATTLLRDAVARGIEVSLEPSSEAGQVAMFYWSEEPRFRGVAVAVVVKYTMFLDDGTPVRATANIQVKQAGRPGFKKGEAKEANTSAEKKSDCSSSPQH